ncbi:prepilin-type N-terminal cleavage/methylation domain-containing protein [Patescibacteria group bacterium]|nr:prepilin-type N-terminal cleavage/methylation domain-containing protein [Patescibacteria group bacterium]
MLKRSRILSLQKKYIKEMFRITYKKGFTLIELLISIAIVAIIAGVVFVALDPLTRFQDARDSTRWTDINAVLSAIKLSQVDNQGSYISAISPGMSDDLYYTIGSCSIGGDSGCGAQTTQTACTNLTALVTSGHIASIPLDPSGGTADKTDYYIQKTATGAITIGACDPEGGNAISVQR